MILWVMLNIIPCAYPPVNQKSISHLRGANRIHSKAPGAQKDMLVVREDTYPTKVCNDWSAPPSLTYPHPRNQALSKGLLTIGFPGKGLIKPRFLRGGTVRGRLTSHNVKDCKTFIGSRPYRLDVSTQPPQDEIWNKRRVILCFARKANFLKKMLINF